ncbi:hypothetical protein PybrP1_003288 [[Pythium] brassicae (nom. inval.)]|nr:hypothetical protein PybrP1_003288 [[Pythium] brassicae (nom. inval.)]
MDLSKILSSYDDDGDDDSSRHEQPPRSPSSQHYHPPLPPPPSLAHHHHHQQQPPQPQRHGHDWSADEMRCAVSILQDFHQPDEAVAAAVSSSSGLPRVRVVHEERKCDEDDMDEDDDMDAKSHTSDAAASGWASGSDLMSKLDLLVQADEIIQSAAAASASARTTTTTTGTADTSATAGFARSGVWMLAEEEYAAALIYYFLKGLLPLREGTTLRKFLAEQLCCNRRRVSMKLATEAIAGKRIPRKVGASVFVAAPDASGADRALAGETLEALRARCFDPLASPTLESRPRPSKQHDELPELLLNEPSAAPAPQPAATPLPTAKSWGDDGRKPSATHPLPSAGSSFLRVSPASRPLETPPRKPLRAHRPAAAELLRSPPGTGNIKRRKPTIIRTGFESLEEEQYVTRLFEYFMAGALELADGTRLVTFLCAQLACSPKTLSMKLAPRRLGERRFPDNVGSITYMRQDARAPRYERDAVDAALQALRIACFDYAHATPTPVGALAARPSSSSSQPAVPPPSTESSAVSAEAAGRERKHSSASSASGGAPSPSRAFSRSGPWSREEEAYAAGLIDCFFKGVLEVSEGTTLRALLAARLRCNPMRVSKKLASEWIADVKIPKKLGSSTFVRRAAAASPEQAAADDALRVLQRAFLRSEAAAAMREDGVAPTAGTKHSRAEEPHDDDDEEEEEDEDEEDDDDDDDERMAASSSPESLSSSSSEDSDGEARVKVEEEEEEEASGRASPRKVRRVLGDADADVKSEPPLEPQRQQHAMAY